MRIAGLGAFLYVRKYAIIKKEISYEAAFVQKGEEGA